MANYISRMVTTQVVLFALLGLKGVVGSESVALGHYKWIPDGEAAAFYRKHSLPVPVGLIVISSGNVFRFSLTDDQGSESTLGTYSCDGGTVTFKIEAGDGAGMPAKMKYDGAVLSSANLSFVREVNSNGKIEVPVAPPPVAPARPAVEGIWHLTSGTKKDPNVRFTFLADGTWKHHGVGSKCSGTYKITDEGIELLYLEIDGAKVDAASHFKKILPFTDDKIGFKVDTYRYEKAGG